MRALARLAAALLCCALAAGAAAARAPDDAAGTLSVQPTSLLDADPGVGECDLGCLAADAARAQTGADAALIPAGELKNDLPTGPLTWASVTNSVSEAPLAVATVTPAQLYALLETALSHLTVDPDTERLLPAQSTWDGFAQIAGFTLTCDASAPAGARVYRVELPDGTRLRRDDEARQLTLVSTEALLADAGIVGEPQALTLALALADYLTATDITALDTGRIRIIGTADAALARRLPGWALIGVLALIALLCLFFRGKEHATKPFRPISEGETRKPY